MGLRPATRDFARDCVGGGACARGSFSVLRRAFDRVIRSDSVLITRTSGGPVVMRVVP